MASSSAPTTKKIALTSSDGEVFEVEEAVAMKSETIKQMIEEGDSCIEKGFPLDNVESKILAKVIEYCKKHAKDEANDEAAAVENLKTWDADFINVSRPTLFEIIMAANYLNIKSLMDLACKTVAEGMVDLQPEEIRLIFGIENDFTHEEEAAIRKENAWAFNV